MTDSMSCFHCGLPVSGGPQYFVPQYFVRIDDIEQPLCCAGCQAVAEAIIASGLTDYYRHRSSMPASPREALPADLQALGLFDHPKFQESFVREIDAQAGEREADLILEGITCAACVWLNEQHIARLPGVTAVQVNYATRRARIRWREGAIRLSRILEAVEAIGYHAYPYDAKHSGELAQRERKTALWRLLVAGFGMMQVMMYAYPAYIAGEGELSAQAASIMRWASLILTLPVVGYSAAPFFARAWRDLRMRRLGMDVPVALGIGSAFLASVWATLSGQGEVYFDSVAMFVFFLLGGRFLELLARQRAVRGAETLARLVPHFARRIEADGSEQQVLAEALSAGDRVRILPGETVVVDGLIESGQSELDESWLTGESRPQLRSVGDEVMAGSINRGSALLVRASATGESTRVATIRRLMETAATQRPKLAEFADRIAARFVLLVLLLAALTALWWWHVDPARALWAAVSVLVVSCPCALSLATPAALTVATGAFARAGLLVTHSHAIETLARVTHFVFDKTGTLSTGRMTLTDVICHDGYEATTVLAIAAALERHSEHAIARAILVVHTGPDLLADEVHVVSGQGVQGRVAGKRWALGKASFVAALAGVAMPERFAGAGESEIFLAGEAEWCAAFRMQDPLRDDALTSVNELARNARISLFSGDAEAPVRRVAQVLGIDDARAAMSPEDKHAAVKALQDAGAVVAMLGDGVNDAPVLAQAHVSLAMAGGTDLARSQADIVLLQDRLAAVTDARRLSRRTLSIIRQNLIWAAAYNLIMIPAAMAGWITPLGAGIGMGASSLFVVLNALRIAR